MIPASGPEKEKVARMVRETISSILPNVPAEQVSGEKSLLEHGADSVDRVEIILSIMNRLGIDEPMSNFSSLSNVDELVNFLCGARQL
jgi:polyketide biosynthesis acyl carrier protein